MLDHLNPDMTAFTPYILAQARIDSDIGVC